MANSSVYAAFERFWQHILIKFSEFSNNIIGGDNVTIIRNGSQVIISASGSGAAAPSDSEMLDFVIETRLVNPIISNSNKAYIDKNGDVYIL